MQDKKNRLIYLVTLSLLLSSLEYLIPKPFPFLKLGLANLPLIISLPILPFYEYILLALSKALIQGLVGGTIISPFFLISLSGTFATSLGMFLAYKLLKRNTFVGISVIGALCSNVAQIFMAAALIYGKSIFVAMPYIIGLGIISSTVLGYLANRFYRDSKF
ncbi:MAG: Gx transporter family protein, partial [Spirochaetaceae bacterium]|nr:Gx transporter family protein [Spirochaetaceae bacterium]